MDAAAYVPKYWRWQVPGWLRFAERFRRINMRRQRLYQTFVPLLPELLSGLHRLQEQDHVDMSIRELAVELSLTVPARLSTLLTFIPLMMKYDSIPFFVANFIRIFECVSIGLVFVFRLIFDCFFSVF